MNHPIPAPENPYGIDSWPQPDRASILIDDRHALMSAADFAKLLDYTDSRPTGVWSGKMWKVCCGGLWYLQWFGHHSNPIFCSNHHRLILIA